jgi:hypothetical protein
MMAGTHPDELALLAYAEGDEVDPAVGEHVQACSACGKRLELLAAGRDALRAAPLLELPPQRRHRILAELPRRRERRTARPLARVLAVAAPVAALAAVALVFVVVGNRAGGDDEGIEAGAERAQTADEAAEAEEGGGAEEPLARTAVREVRGPAREVARLLREEGVDARVVDGSVEVRGATVAEVERVLAGRPSGPVPVYVR